MSADWQSRQGRANIFKNDHIFISHYHAAPDGHSNLDEMLQTVDNDTRSIASDIHPSGIPSGSTHRPFGIFREQEIEILADLSHRVTITAETEAYLHNLVVFLRRNRAVAKGVSPIATTHFKLLSRYASFTKADTVLY